MATGDSSDRFFFGDQSVAEIGGEARDMGVVPWPKIKISKPRVIALGFGGGEILQPFKGGRAGGVKCHAPELTRDNRPSSGDFQTGRGIMVTQNHGLSAVVIG